MSQDKEAPISLEGYFEIQIDKIKINSKLNFDCYIHLEKNNKLIHWIRADDLFLQDHLDKLAKFKSTKILGLNSQKNKFEIYVQEQKIEQEKDIKNKTETNEKYGKFDKSKYKNVFGLSISGQKDRVLISGGGYVPQGDLKLKRLKSDEDPLGVASKPIAPKVAPKMKVDVEFLNTIIQYTQNAFQEICDATVQFRPPFPRKNNNAFEIEIAAFISLVSQTIRGSIGLCFPAQTYLYLINKTSDEKLATITPNIIAGSGELMSTIFEKSRPHLIAQGYQLERAVPTIVTGKNLSLPHLMPDPGFSIIFDSPGGMFQFEVGIKTGG